MRDAFVRKLTELAQSDPRIMLLTADLGFGVLDRFEKQLPRQFLNVGVAEQNMTGIATGLAMEGRIVFTYSIANFPTLRCLEQLRNDACYHRASVKVVSVGAGFSYGALGISHHATEDVSIIRSLPEITLLSPGDDWETEQATQVLVDTSGPGLLRIDKSPVASTQQPGEKFMLGKPRIVRQGADFTLACTGAMLPVTIKAAAGLATKGVSCRVIHYHSIKPFCVEALLAAADETGGILTIEEHSIHGGFGGLVAEELLENGGRPRVFYRMGLRGGFSSAVGSQEYLRALYGLDCAAIESRVLELIGRQGTVKP